MATVNNIRTSVENVAPGHSLIGIRRPIVFACTVAPLLVWLLWELMR